MLIRRERPQDVDPIRAVVAAAFAAAPHSTPPVDETGDPGEAALVGWLRADEGWLPELSLVAVDEHGSIVGHVVCTRGWVGEAPALGLGPLSVAPAHQGSGVGSELMRSVIEAADAAGEPLIALLGDPDFYRRFGFGPSREFGVEAPNPAWGDFFQAKPLGAYKSAISGRFRYAAPFDRL